MRIDVADIKHEVGSYKVTDLAITLEPVELGGAEVGFGRPFTGTAKIWNLGDRLLVQAELQGEARLTCSRCLCEYTHPLSVSFEAEFVEREPGADEPVVEDEEESDKDVSFYSDDVVDMTEVARDNILLALPMKPLCSEFCKGLCPRCGKDLNEGPCGCDGGVEESVDPRLAVLRDLLRKPDANS
ncbi:MAG: DUF177 domain-containing protein [Bacillota bacterium]|nr:MAG: metal-binding protein [Bacillota bacterium]